MDIRCRTEEGHRVPSTVFLDPWLFPLGTSLAGLTDDLLSRMEIHRTDRTRRARKDAIERKRTCIGNILANLAGMALGPIPDAGRMIAVPTGKTKATRYDREDYPQRILAETLIALEGEGILERHAYIYKQKATTIAPTKEFSTLLAQRKVHMKDIGRQSGGETIWLNARTGEAVLGNEPPAKTLINYADTDESKCLSMEMSKINEMLNGAAIKYAGQSVLPISLVRSFLLRSPNEQIAFNLNGRLWKGFWQNVSSNQRHLITIGGEDIVDLDFSAMFPSMIYLMVTGKLPSDDPYDIPGLEVHRAGAKMGLMSLLSRTGPMKNLAPKLKVLLPEGWTARRLNDVMNARHPALSPFFGKDTGVSLMNTESRILMKLLLDLEGRGIPSLPMHDGIIVKFSDKQAAIEAMLRASKAVLGVALPIKEKPILRSLSSIAA